MILVTIPMTLSSFLLGLTDYGWHREDGQLRVTWDTVENIQQIQRNVEYLTQGCKCKTGSTDDDESDSDEAQRLEELNREVVAGWWRD